MNKSISLPLMDLIKWAYQRNDSPLQASKKTKKTSTKKISIKKKRASTVVSNKVKYARPPFFNHTPTIDESIILSCHKWLSWHRSKGMSFNALLEFFLQHDPFAIQSFYRPPAFVERLAAEFYDLDYYYKGLKCMNGHRSARKRKNNRCLCCEKLTEIFYQWKEK